MDEYPATIRSFLQRIYTPEKRVFAFKGSTPEDVDAWLEKARPALRKLIGLDVIENSQGNFKPYVVFEEKAEKIGNYSRQKGTLYSEEDIAIPFWILKPEGDGPFPLGIFPHGHADYGMDQYVGLYETDEQKRIIETEDRDVAVQAVEKGYVAVAPTTRGFRPAAVVDIGGRHGNRNCRSQFMHAILAGRTAIGERVWDLSRMIDWAETQDDVDCTQILMMGNSGGGVATYYAAACETRITVAVPSCSFCTFVGENGRVHSCDCNAVPGIMRFGDASDVAGLIAPRHLCIVNGKKDELFPLPEIDKAVNRVKEIYRAAGCPEHFIHGYGEEGHRFYRDLMWPFVDSIIKTESRK